MKSLLSGLILASFGFTLPMAFAAPPSADYYTIHSVETRQLSLTDTAVTDPEVGNGPSRVFPDFNISELGELINLGREIWNIVVANHPVVNLSTESANAIPRAAETAAGLDHWRGTKAGTYEVIYKNLLGMTVTKLRYQVSFQYGGRFKDAGHFIANATIVPEAVEVIWGYTFNVSVKTLPPVNVGSARDPIASLPLFLSWKVTTPIVEQDGTSHFELQGNGELHDLN